MSDSWVAIDFETASTRGTPCAVGLAEVDEGHVSGRHSWLIRPPVFEFSPFNIAVHGITPDMCREAPDWEQSLERILQLTDGRPLVAHNAAFDIGVIRDACDVTGIEWPRVEYACTLVVGRRVWPSLPTHSLPFLAAHLGIDAAAHHDAGADAVCAAEIGCRALDVEEAAGLEELVAGCNATMGRLGPTEWRGSHGRGSGSGPLPTGPTAGVTIDGDHPLYGKRIAFTGALAIPRRDAQQAAVNRGAVASRGVRRDTDLLVCGFQDMTRLATGESKSAKLRKAESLRAAGRAIEIVGEREFVELLGESTDP
jgi:DNA polymerase III epsilon subunit-like protein